uniref:Ig-like domain-containing protein n=1 Tax=Loxodonta africana TaxID=9785 RepID=G3UJF9_LOXAF
TTQTHTSLLCLGLCWGEQNQVQTGSLPKPSHWATSGPIITMGSSVTIWCQGSPQADTYWLYKEGVTQYWDKWAPWNYVDTVSFRIEFMNTGHARQFQCAYQSSSGWSGWIGPLLLVMTGAYSKPSLSAHPSPLVVSGGSVSLSCSSKDRTDTFYLLKEEGLIVPPPQRLHWQKNAGPFQANFTMSLMTSTHGGTYRCYSSHSTSPYLLSQPSEPLELVVSGEEPLTLSPLCPNGSSGICPQPPPISPRAAVRHSLTHAQGLPQYLKVLIGVLVAFIRHHRQGKMRSLRGRQDDFQLLTGKTVSEPKDRGLPKSSCPATEDKDENLCEDAAVRDKQPEKEMELDSQQRPKDENSQGRMCTQVTHHSRPRQGVATFPSSLFGELQDMKDRQVEEDSQRDSQAAAPEDPQDVTYVELNHPTQRRETTAPCSSQSGELSNDPILYAAVAIH